MATGHSMDTDLDLAEYLSNLKLDDKKSIKVPTPLTKLYNKKYKAMSEEQLKRECQLLAGTFKLTKEEQDIIQMATVVQRKSNEWYQQRCGRLTASQFHRIIHCSKGMVNLTKDITSPNPKQLKVTAIQWGIDHEETAQNQYVQKMKQSHTNFQCKNVGLLVLADMSYIAASPDGLIECDCCGNGVLEIKCPYKFKDKHPNIIHTEDKKHCLDEDNKLKENHPYFYQIQGQMATANVKYGDFVIWTTKDLLILRIKFKEEFWKECVDKMTNIFIKNILPELLTRKLTTNKNDPKKNVQDDKSLVHKHSQDISVKYTQK